MSRKPRPSLSLLLLSLAIVAQACRVSQGPAPQSLLSNTPLSPLTLGTVTPVVPAFLANTSTPRVVPTRTPIVTPTPTPVSITAVNGDLAIRTGPDTVFDAVDRLQAGQTLPVHARSIQDGWLQVPIPSQPGSLGWVSTKTGFSRVDGYVLDLPLITAVDWPFGAYLINCTPHQLIAQPDDKLMPPVSAAPANRVWFFPGLYTIYDADMTDRPEITQVKLYEHTDVSVISDGTGTKYTCP